MYIQYSIARNENIQTFISTHTNHGKFICGEHVNTNEAIEQLNRIKNLNKFKVIQLPPDGDSDYYDKSLIIEL